MEDARPVEAAAPRNLLRVVGMAFGIAAVIGGTIGGGILRTPGTIAAALQDPALILAVWVGCGLLANLGERSDQAALGHADGLLGAHHEVVEQPYVD